MSRRDDRQRDEAFWLGRPVPPDRALPHAHLATGMALRALRGVVVNLETIGADLIKSVGPGCNFLRQPHTVKRMRSEFFFPKLSDRELREDWEAPGALDARQRANAIAREFLDEYQPEPIPKEIDAEI